jgi:hypothetical protein
MIAWRRVQPGREAALEALLTILALVPVGALVGIASWAIIRKAMRSELKKNPIDKPDSATEVARIAAQDRADARALYERITRDKLDVIKTALAMGYDRQDLKELDDRLEELIGSDKLHALIASQDAGVPPLKAELLDLDLSQELENLKRGKELQ